MKIVMLSMTPLAAAPYELLHCLRTYTDHDVVWATVQSEFPGGWTFPSDLVWSAHKEQIMEHVAQADIIHVQNSMAPWFEKHVMDKPVLVQFHSVPIRRNHDWLCSLATKCYTIRQPMQQRQFPTIPTLPNVIDCEKYKGLNLDRNRPHVVFAPTNNWHLSAVGTKGKAFVIEVLEQFEGQLSFDIFSRIPYEENLLRKQQADIIIDDIINGTFHRTSLEGSCFGAAVLSSAGKDQWMHTTKETLVRNLCLLAKNRDLLKSYQERSRRWIEQEWHPSELVKEYIEAYETTIATKNRKGKL